MYVCVYLWVFSSVYPYVCIFLCVHMWGGNLQTFQKVPVNPNELKDFFCEGPFLKKQKNNKDFSSAILKICQRKSLTFAFISHLESFFPCNILVAFHVNFGLILSFFTSCSFLSKQIKTECFFVSLLFPLFQPTELLSPFVCQAIFHNKHWWTIKKNLLEFKKTTLRPRAKRS